MPFDVLVEGCAPEGSVTLSLNVKDIARNGVTNNELTTAKNKILSTLVIKNELPMGRLIDLGLNWTYLQQYRTIEQDVLAVKEVTVDDINDLIRRLDPGDFTQLSMGPALGD